MEFKITNNQLSEEQLEVLNDLVQHQALSDRLSYLEKLDEIYLMLQDSAAYFIDERNYNIYRIIEIGSQRWLGSNLRYNSSGSYENPANPSRQYGRLYTWDDACGVCPSGWHLPSDGEWKILERYLGMSSESANNTGWRSSGEVGKKLKSTSGWNNNGNGEDAFGFAALPAGYYYDGSFRHLDKHTYFWSATEESSGNAWCRSLYNYHDSTFRYYGSKSIGLSVRCLKD